MTGFYLIHHLLKSFAFKGSITQEFESFMTSTPGRARSPPVDENCATPPSQKHGDNEPRSKCKRKGRSVHVPHYALPHAPLKELAPEKQTAAPSAPASGRGAMPRQRLDKPTEQFPCHDTLSASGRFGKPGSHYKQNQVPGIGSYEPKVQRACTVQPHTGQAWLCSVCKYVLSLSDLATKPALHAVNTADAREKDSWC